MLTTSRRSKALAACAVFSAVAAYAADPADNRPELPRMVKVFSRTMTMDRVFGSMQGPQDTRQFRLSKNAEKDFDERALEN